MTKIYNLIRELKDYLNRRPKLHVKTCFICEQKRVLLRFALCWFYLTNTYLCFYKINFLIPRCLIGGWKGCKLYNGYTVFF